MTSPTDFARAAQGLAAALGASAADPTDALRLLTTLAAPVSLTPTPGSPVGMSMAAMQKSMGDLFRRSAVVAMARASAVYQPSSADDAAAVRASVCGLLDAEILVAGAQYEDATYAALRALRVAVSSDLTARGAGLAPLTTIKTNSPMPALALAQRVYRDPARSDELILESNSIHPAFMKTRFKALSQ